jgi:hypothetical protein
MLEKTKILAKELGLISERSSEIRKELYNLVREILLRELFYISGKRNKLQFLQYRNAEYPKDIWINGILFLIRDVDSDNTELLPKSFLAIKPDLVYDAIENAILIKGGDGGGVVWYRSSRSWEIVNELDPKTRSKVEELHNKFNTLEITGLLA